ncbi:MAG: cell division protein ZapA [Bacteroidota bacterium]
MSTIIPINLILGDRTYRIKIKNTDEARVRDLAKALNDQLMQFKRQYAGKDMQDYLAMVLLSHVLENKEDQVSPAAIAPVEFDIVPHLERMESLLNKVLD